MASTIDFREPIRHRRPSDTQRKQVRFAGEPVFGPESQTVKNLLFDLGDLKLGSEPREEPQSPESPQLNLGFNPLSHLTSPPSPDSSIPSSLSSSPKCCSSNCEEKKAVKSTPDLKKTPSKGIIKNCRRMSEDDEDQVKRSSSLSSSPMESSCSSLDSSLSSSMESIEQNPFVVNNLLFNIGALKLDSPHNLTDGRKFEVDDFGRDKMLGEKCGLFGCVANGDWPTNLDVAHIICLGLVGLQHRGQEAAGIVTCKYVTEPFSVHRGMGLVSSIFNDPVMLTLKGNLGIGHTRYSTMGGSENVQLAQPFIVHTSYGTIGVGHNGELVNSQNLRRRILENGVGLSTGSDSELITQCLSMPPPPQFRLNKTRRRVNTNEMKKRAAAKAAAVKAAKEKRASETGSNSDKENEQNIVNDQVNDHVNDHIIITDENGHDTEHDGEKEREHPHMHSRWESLITSPSVGNFIAELDEELDPKDEEMVSRLLHLMSLTPLSYSLLIMYNEALYACRDPYGNRPLCIGMLVPPPGATDNVLQGAIEGWVVSSESCSFPSVCAKVWRDVRPGEIIKLQRNEMPKTLVTIRPEPPHPPAMCIFEYVYFARPDSMIEGQMVYAVRKKCGRQLAIEAPIPNLNRYKDDIIVAPVPESSIPAALGFSEQSGIPYVEVFCKNRYVGRTFIQPSTRLRRLGVAKKFGPLTQNFEGKSIVLIDDSIVRGTTIGQLIRLLKDAGAKEVHIRIASPPLHHPCYMGINIPTAEELIANHLSPEQLAKTLGASSLVHLSVDGLQKSVQTGIKANIRRECKLINEPITEEDIDLEVGHCTACLTGKYPVELEF